MPSRPKSDPLNPAQRAALEAIDNFILYYSSSETVRALMQDAAREYVAEDHVLSVPVVQPPVTQRVWVVAYEQPAEPELMVALRYTQKEAEQVARKVNRELDEWGYNSTTTAVHSFVVEVQPPSNPKGRAR